MEAIASDFSLLSDGPLSNYSTYNQDVLQFKPKLWVQCTNQGKVLLIYIASGIKLEKYYWPFVPDRHEGQ